MIVYTDYRFDARVRREAETLAAAGFQVRCIIPRLESGPREFTDGGVQVRTVPVVKYQGKNTGRYLASYFKFLVLAGAACARMHARQRFDVVHVHNLPDFLVFAAAIPRLFGAKVVLDVHDSVPETFITKFPGWHPGLFKALCLEERLSAALAHRVICVNEPQRDALVGRGLPKAKTFISMNVPDHRIFGSGLPDVPVQNSGDRADDGFSLVYHGTMARRLGVDLIIEAAAMLRDRIPDLKLHLWGPGDDLPEFQARVEQLSLNGVVQFAPRGYALAELPQRLSRMQVGVVGNRGNAATELMLPVKLMEYVALGIPAVVPRLRTIQHYFDDDMVAFYEPENVASMADQIYRLYADPSRREAQARKARAFLERHGWEIQGAALVRFYEELLERRLN